MKDTPCPVLFRAVCAVLVLAAFAARANAQIAEKGPLLLQEDFRTHAVYTKELLTLQPGWRVRVAHGKWERTADGVRSTWETGHSPVLVVEGEFGDAVIEVDFRYRREPGRWAACRVSATNAALFPRGYAASVWANTDFDSRGRGLWLENDKWDGPITRVGYAKAKYEPDTWYTLRFELVGANAAVECGDFKVKGSHEKFALPKTSLWLGTGQSAHELRRLRVYAARPKAPPAAVR